LPVRARANSGRRVYGAIGAWRPGDLPVRARAKFQTGRRPLVVPNPCCYHPVVIGAGGFDQSFRRKVVQNRRPTSGKAGRGCEPLSHVAASSGRLGSCKAPTGWQTTARSARWTSSEDHGGHPASPTGTMRSVWFGKRRRRAGRKSRSGAEIARDVGEARRDARAMESGAQVYNPDLSWTDRSRKNR
jgi:hypothetical protein